MSLRWPPVKLTLVAYRQPSSGNGGIQIIHRGGAWVRQCLKGWQQELRRGWPIEERSQTLDREMLHALHLLRGTPLQTTCKIIRNLNRHGTIVSIHTCP